MLNPQATILWTQVFGLGLVQGAITLMWLVYNLYLGELLSQFGFPAAVVTGILILENLLAMVMEPLMGNYSDRAQRWLGSRFPFIAIGVILASGLLMAIATLVTFGQGITAIRWLLPILLVAWAIAMTVFRSPALALLGRYAYGRGLPQAASLLTAMGALIGALGPTAKDFILSLGAPVAFGLASLVLLAAAATLRALQPNEQATPPPATTARSLPLSIVNLALIFAAGWGISISGRLMMQAFPQVLATIPGLSVGLTMGFVFITVAVTAIPMGLMAKRMGYQRGMLVAITGLALLVIVMGWVHQAGVAILLAIALGTLLSLLRNGVIPFALSMVPAEKSGLGVGLFFSGGACANNLLATVFKPPATIDPSVTVGVTIVGLLVAGIAIAHSDRLHPRTR